MDWNPRLNTDQRKLFLGHQGPLKNGNSTAPTDFIPTQEPTESMVFGTSQTLDAKAPTDLSGRRTDHAPAPAGESLPPHSKHQITEPSRVERNPVTPLSSNAPLFQEEAFSGSIESTLGGLEAPASFKFGGFLEGLTSHPQGEAWKNVWTEQTQPTQGVVDVPFAFPGDAQGKLELGDADLHYRGLRALGAEEAARGTLENWLDLGQRFTALPGRNRLNELGRSGMPRLSGVMLEEAERSGDVSFLKDAYQVIGDDHRQNWSDTYFKATPNGLNRFCDVDYSHDATLDEAGGEVQTARYGGDPMPFNPIDLNAHLFATEKNLAVMARDLTEVGQGTSEEIAQWTSEAALWDGKALARKEILLEKLWDDEIGIFRDLKTESGMQSPVISMATFSVLEAGLLDPSNPKEKAMIDRLVGNLGRFEQDGSYQWDLESKTPAPASELTRVSAGLKAYGFEKEASAVAQAAGSIPTTGALQPGAVTLCTEAILGKSEKLTGLSAVTLSPVAQKRADQLGSLLGQTSGRTQLKSGQERQIESALRRFDQSLLTPDVVTSLSARRLNAAVFGLKFEGQTIRVEEAPRPPSVTVSGNGVQVGDLTIDTGLPQVKVGALADGAVTMTRNGATLAVVDMGDKIVIGDKVYPAELLSKNKGSLPKLLTSFHTAGGNPTLETFLHRNREWIQVDKTTGSQPSQLATKPEWNRLYDKTHAGWEALTIDPSVVAHDTATQYFNPAAVPSLGIFKTQFNWDTEFMAVGMQKQGQNALVSDMTDNLLYLLKTTGRVPNAARSVYLNKSQPPFLPDLVKRSTAEREQRFGVEATKEWKTQAYQLMSADFHDFWQEEGERKVPDIGGKPRHLSRWGGDNHKFAMDESGFDTTSRFDGKTKDLVPPDLNAFLYKYSTDMAEMADDFAQSAQDEGDVGKLLKYTSEGALWRQEAKNIKADLIELCWDEEDGMFRDYQFEGEPAGLQKDCDALSAVVAPIWAGMLDPDDPIEARMLERSLDNISSRFEKDHGLAATAEDYGHPEMQWNGPSGWAPLMMMAVGAEKRYGRVDDAARHTEKWMDNLAGVNEKDQMIIERYDVVNGGHPPIQKGRYEETQGEGPGFGWTNATVPWAMVEVFAGADTVSGPDGKRSLEIKPCLPRSLHGQKVAVDYEVPGTSQTCHFSHLYEPEKKSYSFEFQGALDALPRLELTTPPMPAGMLPRFAGDVPGYRLETTRKDGQEVHRIRFDQAPGERALSLNFGPSESTAP